MTTKNLPKAAKNLIETSRMTVVSAIDAGHQNARKALNGCDDLFQAGADALDCAQVLAAAKLRDELISLEGQLTLLATLAARGIANQTVSATNGAACMALSAADKYDQVFDLRVMKALDRMGVPACETVEAVAASVASVAAEIDRLLQTLPYVPVAPVPKAIKTVAKPRTALLRRSGKRAAQTAH